MHPLMEQLEHLKADAEKHGLCKCPTVQCHHDVAYWVLNPDCKELNDLQAVAVKFMHQHFERRQLCELLETTATGRNTNRFYAYTTFIPAVGSIVGCGGALFEVESGRVDQFDDRARVVLYVKRQTSRGAYELHSQIQEEKFKHKEQKLLEQYTSIAKIPISREWVEAQFGMDIETEVHPFPPIVSCFNYYEHTSCPHCWFVFKVPSFTKHVADAYIECASCGWAIKGTNPQLPMLLESL